MYGLRCVVSWTVSNHDRSSCERTVIFHSTGGLKVLLTLIKLFDMYCFPKKKEIQSETVCSSTSKTVAPVRKTIQCGAAAAVVKASEDVCLQLFHKLT